MSLRLKLGILAITVFVTTQMGNAETSPVQLSHIAPALESLPVPGQMMTLSVRADQTNAFQWPLRALIVRDGRVMDVRLERGKLDAQERPLFEVQIPSPVRDLSYQFYLYKPDNTVSVSQRYAIERKCAPVMALSVVPEESSELPTDPEELGLLADTLERDVRWYRTAADIASRLQKVLEGAS